ncbi:hypothetical protein M2163_001027 [Streptomyces sp. SAI-135]|uniref:hypothetical protein n=1 Tax=unclassified Streptomyces TaxID=2593676 RepID=UPI0024739CA7|nr:hypothetical protein [Streptomyces sp. SAI-090]MDH6521978.1 hypothetical protein [Streptomyces sp. SAI-090]MDH6573347.1 hypothetical protein [Streptomyces sp. SAI-117]MDH6613919.1 hypothetical protein [Streptomyces sp. SAI-135]
MLADVDPPIVPVWSTTDLDEALLWYETLEGTDVEGIVAKPLRSAYKAVQVWAKVQHADTVDATVVGFTGSARPCTATRRTGDAAPSAHHGTPVLRDARPVPQAGRACTKAGDS